MLVRQIRWVVMDMFGSGLLGWMGPGICAIRDKVFKA